MTLAPKQIYIAGFLALLAVCPSWAQKSGGTGTQAPSQSGNSTTSRQPTPSQPAQMQTPLQLTGRVMMDTGQPVPEPVPIGLYCGMRTLQVIRTDMKGYFQFTLGAGAQGNADYSASESAGGQVLLGDNSMIPGQGFGGLNPSGNSLTGCELRISVAGYQPVTTTITEPAELGMIEIGTIGLRRLAGAEGSAISATSLLVPGSARKEFDQGIKDLRSNHVPSATQHLEKAVGQYDKYAAAWTELGKIYANGNQYEKANQAFGKAILADPKYVPPYLSLAALDVQTQDYENAVTMAGKALDMDPTLGMAGFVEAIAYYRLNKFEDAAKVGRDVEKGPHQNIPELHALLADTLAQKDDLPGAAAEMRAYLKEWPHGPSAAAMKHNLDQIDTWLSTGADAKAPGAPEDIAP